MQVRTSAPFLSGYFVLRTWSWTPLFFHCLPRHHLRRRWPSPEPKVARHQEAQYPGARRQMGNVVQKLPPRRHEHETTTEARLWGRAARDMHGRLTRMEQQPRDTRAWSLSFHFHPLPEAWGSSSTYLHSYQQRVGDNRLRESRNRSKNKNE
ncbi:hypothetical protein LZ30DRAFT_274543 [Colletotrichum cereale]|nr:hypothetical protein LZ30DRAFT_274543 [Colletotrichum cereale]